MASKYETIGGVVTRGECYAKLIDLLDQVMDQCAVMAHLHNTEGSDSDKLLAKGWLGMVELMSRIRHQMTQLAQGRLQ